MTFNFRSEFPHTTAKSHEDHSHHHKHEPSPIPPEPHHNKHESPLEPTPATHHKHESPETNSNPHHRYAPTSTHHSPSRRFLNRFRRKNKQHPTSTHHPDDFTSDPPSETAIPPHEESISIQTHSSNQHSSSKSISSPIQIDQNYNDQYPPIITEHPSSSSNKEPYDDHSIVLAAGIALTGPWGPVFGPVNLDIPTGGVTVLIGPPGSGRTSLLMCLAGRMKPTEGSLTVLGHSRPCDIFANTGLAGIEKLDSIDESVTVTDLITEQARWDAPWYRIVRRCGEKELEQLCQPVFGHLALPNLKEYVEELNELDGLLLRIALANTKNPSLLVIGSLDQVNHMPRRYTLLERLVELGKHQTIITASANHIPPEHDPGIRLQIPLHYVARSELTGRHRSDQQKRK